MHHVGSPTAVGEPEMTGANFGGWVNAGEPGDGGPVNAGEPADGGPVNAGEPDVVPDADADADHNGHDDAAQPMDDGEGDPSEGGSSNDEAPESENPWGSLHTHGLDPDFEVDRDFDLHVEDLDSDGSEYASYLSASNSMPRVQNLVPGSPGSTQKCDSLP